MEKTLLLSTTHPLISLDSGAEIVVDLPLKGANDSTLSQLLAGSLLPHALPVVSSKKGVDVELRAKYPCTCFGGEVATDAVVAHLTFAGAQSDEQKIALAEQFALGRFNGKVAIKTNKKAD